MKKTSLKKIIILTLVSIVLVQSYPKETFAKEKNSSTYYSTGTIVLDTEKGEMLTGDGVVWNNNNKRDMKKLVDKYKGKCKLNQIQTLKQITFKDINELTVSVSKYGAAIEPISGNHIIISYVGPDDKSKVKVTTSKVNQKLVVNIKGDEKHTFYINPSEKTRANTIKIGIPKKLFNKINIDGNTGSTVISKTGSIINGKSKSGIIIVKENTASKKIDMETLNGIVRVEGNHIKEGVSLKSTNGTTVLKSDTVTGSIKMETRNGIVNLKAGSLSKSQLKATNGIVNAKVGKLTGNTKAIVSNGVLRFELTKKPKNLKFVLDGTANKWTNTWKLPSGWKNGHIVGTGKPVLTLKAASNGILKFEVAK